MARSDRFRGLRCQLCLIALVMTTGCATSRTNLRDDLGRRVQPVEVDTGRGTSQPQAKAGDRATITVIKEGLDTPTSAIALGRTIYGVERKIEFVNTPQLKGKDPGPFKIIALPLPSS